MRELALNDEILMKVDKLSIEHIKEIFKNSRNNYGSRKIKVELKKKGIIASKRQIK